MLYYIFRYLNNAFDVPGAGMWEYVSTRAITALILALIISMSFGEWFIRYMRRKNRCEAQRNREIDPFGVDKVGVPTMGGIIIIVATVVPCLLVGRLRNIYMLLMLFTTLWLGLLGFLDDYLKGHSKQYDRLPAALKRISEFCGASAEYRKNNKNGMRPIVKLLGQALLGLGVGLTLWLAPDAVLRESGHLIKSTLTTLPFVKCHNLDYAGFFAFLGSWQQAAGWVFFVCVTTFIIMAVSNGSNLDDGMDGLCAGNSAIMSVALVILAYFSSHAGFADYFNIMNIPGCQELVVFGAAFVGALIGFLWYNAYPAQVFMGDTGSLPIGGIMAMHGTISAADFITVIILSVGLITPLITLMSYSDDIRKELLLPIICFVFLIESVSVLGQNFVARKGNAIGKKYRFVTRAPIHDAFRLKPEQLVQLRSMDKILLKWPRSSFHENKVTARFWIVTIILASFAIMTLKVR